MITEKMKRAAAEVLQEIARKAGAIQPLEAFYAEATAALEAAERAAWRPVEEADPEMEYLLYYPEKVTGAHKQAKLPARVVVGYPGDSPNRPPTHFRPLPSPPEAPKGEDL
ncbi:hypothetical protein [Labrys sp. ZIDIC5]|uniref:hypothetical protein n=1 Tax=Labrys sedimenti TaxID=3106036 RepID=UPI002ACA245D|nr:hypothetical protein [Labrys sp. ZIDIC5]MDZ5448927.1 hypothetical protein [Labrys sp. ZIDIC5]